MEELRELLSVIGQAPDIALNAFILFGAYKAFVFGSTTAGIYGVLRLAINKYHDLETKKLTTEKIINYKIDEELFMSFESQSLLPQLLKELKPDHLKYIHKDDMQNAIMAIREAKNESKN